MLKKKQLKWYKPQKMKGQYYGSPNWFDSNGLLKKYEQKLDEAW